MKKETFYVFQLIGFDMSNDCIIFFSSFLSCSVSMHASWSKQSTYMWKRVLSKNANREGVFFLHKKNEFSTSHAYKSARISLENVKCSCTLIWLLLHRFRYTIYSCVFVVAPSQSWFIINSITDLHHKILFKTFS